MKSLIPSPNMKYVDCFEEYYCQGPKLFLKLTGLWPFQPSFRRRFSLICYSTLSISFALPHMLFLVRNSDREFDVLVENVGAIFFNLLGVIHYTATYVNSKKFGDLYTEAVEKWRSITDEEERKILTKFVWTAWFVGIVYTGYMVVNGWTFVPAVPVICALLDHFIPPQNGTQFKFVPINADYFFFRQEDHYWFVWIHAIIGINAVCSVFSGLNTMYIILIREICGLYDIVSFRLTNNVLELQDTSGDNIHNSSENTVHNKLKRAIILHDQVSRFGELLENTFNLMIMLVQLINILLLSILYYYLVYADVPFFKTVGASIALVGTNAYLFCINWIGQEIIDYSSQVFEIAYATDWDLMTLKDRKMILFIMVRSLKPLYLTSGRLYPMSMESFGKMTKAKFTYFTAITSMQ